MMSRKDKISHIPALDRLGQFIGQLRTYEGVTLEQLAQGLCSPPYLNRIEKGEREVGKQLTDALFQRLGKPSELFERILDPDEFQQWTHRQKILFYLNDGNAGQALALVKKYQKTASGVLDQQFIKMVEINCRYLLGAAKTELFPMVRDALLYTQPHFQTTPVEKLLLSRNEGQLLFAYLRLKEEQEGFDSVAVSYHALLHYFKKPRYESRERVYLFPYVALRVIAHDYHTGQYLSALTICEEALQELSKEHRLYACVSLLEWQQRLYDAVGRNDRTPEKLLTHLSAIQQQYAPPRTALLFPCEERGNAYCLNHVLQERRKLLDISQESLAEGICTPRTISRIENNGGKIQRENRRKLLQKVNLSGEQYDYEVITDRYEDYLLRSELDRAIFTADYKCAEQILSQLQQRIPNLPTNHQYLLKTKAHLEVCKSSKQLSTKMTDRLEAAIHLTLPRDLAQIDTWPPSVLSINELLTLLYYAMCCKKQGEYQRGLSVLFYLKRSLCRTEHDKFLYEDLYTRVETRIADMLGDMGQYQESNALSCSCIRLSLENNKLGRIAQNLYNIAWNTTQQLSRYSSEETAQRIQTACTLLKSGYAVALLTHDTVMQTYCSDYYRELCGDTLVL